MALDDIAFHRRQIITAPGIFQCNRRMMKPVKPSDIAVFVPVISIKIMKKRTAHQFGVRRSQMKMTIQIIA